MLLNEEFMKIYEELESINGEELTEKANPNEYKIFSQKLLCEIDEYIKMFCEWTVKDFDLGDDGSATLYYDTTGGKDPNDEEVIDNLGYFTDKRDVALELDIEPEGKANTLIVYLDILNV